MRPDLPSDRPLPPGRPAAPSARVRPRGVQRFRVGAIGSPNAITGIDSRPALAQVICSSRRGEEQPASFMKLSRTRFSFFATWRIRRLHHRRRQPGGEEHRRELPWSPRPRSIGHAGGTDLAKACSDAGTRRARRQPDRSNQVAGCERTRWRWSGA